KPGQQQQHEQAPDRSGTRGHGCDGGQGAPRMGGAGPRTKIPRYGKQARASRLAVVTGYPACLPAGAALVPVGSPRPWLPAPVAPLMHAPDPLPDDGQPPASWQPGPSPPFPSVPPPLDIPSASPAPPAARPCGRGEGSCPPGASLPTCPSPSAGTCGRMRPAAGGGDIAAVAPASGRRGVAAAGGQLPAPAPGSSARFTSSRALGSSSVDRSPGSRCSARACSERRSSFPDRVLGRALTTYTRCGRATAPSWLATVCSIALAAPAGSASPRLRVANTTGTWPL